MGPVSVAGGLGKVRARGGRARSAGPLSVGVQILGRDAQPPSQERPAARRRPLAAQHGPLGAPEASAQVPRLLQLPGRPQQLRALEIRQRRRSPGLRRLRRRPSLRPPRLGRRPSQPRGLPRHGAHDLAVQRRAPLRAPRLVQARRHPRRPLRQNPELRRQTRPRPRPLRPAPPRQRPRPRPLPLGPTRLPRTPPLRQPPVRRGGGLVSGAEESRLLPLLLPHLRSFVLRRSSYLEE
mmetsp:Transcript_29971/g.91765  ORF Transcript_29971/g.91765 Transcript_29971/m.91765 type:complete len:237 (+) Transcript_29971:596-1306(+)